MVTREGGDCAGWVGFGVSARQRFYGLRSVVKTDWFCCYDGQDAERARNVAYSPLGAVDIDVCRGWASEFRLDYGGLSR